MHARAMRSLQNKPSSMRLPSSRGIRPTATISESRWADSTDTREWLEARRALRDANLRMSVCLKELDMGDVSSAGQRSYFENIYQQFVVPRMPFDNMQQAQVSFSYHRKMVGTLQTGMNNALLNARNNAERPAQKIISRLAAKMREAQTKKNVLGVVLD